MRRSKEDSDEQSLRCQVEVEVICASHSMNLNFMLPPKNNKIKIDNCTGCVFVYLHIVPCLGSVGTLVTAKSPLFSMSQQVCFQAPLTNVFKTQGLWA